MVAKTDVQVPKIDVAEKGHSRWKMSLALGAFR